MVKIALLCRQNNVTVSFVIVSYFSVHYTLSMASIDTFWRLGHKITGYELEGSLSVGYRKFRSFFGTTPLVCFVSWDMLSPVRPRKSAPKHLLWALMLLKNYSTESVNAGLTDVDEKTFRKWSLIFVNLLANMTVVNK